MELKNRIDIENPDKIKELLQTNTLNRNVHLNNIIKIFNNMSSQVTLSIDGGWGTGKTVFAKQLEYLANTEELKGEREYFFGIDEGELIRFKKDSDIYYFNSWEYDMYGNPLEILLYDLIKHRKNAMLRQDKNIEKLDKTIQKYFLPIVKTTIKTLSGGSVDVNDLFSGETKDEKLLKVLLDTDELKKRIFEILSALTEEKKIIIIIDELDRCKPTFAIELLEVIKHYFLNDKISYIICSNKSELSNTVKQYYGNEFNGYGYLDRFIDFEYNLPEPSVENYLEEVFKIREIAGYHTNLANTSGVSFRKLLEINAVYFKLTLRQINKYCLLSELIITRFIIKRSEPNSGVDSLYGLIFPLYVVGLKITNPKSYEQFFEGNSDSELKLYINSKYEFFASILHYNDNLSRSIESSVALQNHVKREYLAIKDSRKSDLLDALTYVE